MRIKVKLDRRLQVPVTSLRHTPLYQAYTFTSTKVNMRFET